MDYFNLEVYEHGQDPLLADTIGGGFMMRTKLIRDEFYNKPVTEVIKEVFRANGKEDVFELGVSELPDYKIVERKEAV